MKLLGIDYGEKKIGLALSDEREKFAFPHSVLNNISANSVLRTLKIICDKNNIGKIVIGQSLNFKMQPNAIMKRIEKFKSFLEERLKIPIELENEVLTTKHAERFSKKDNKIHASAAALILQTYLDRRNLPR